VNVWVTRPQAPDCLLRQTLLLLGASVIDLPLLSVQPISPPPSLPISLLHKAPPDWLLFTSQQAVKTWVAHPQAKAGLGSKTKIATVGLKTAQAVDALAGLPVHLVSPVADASHLWSALIPRLSSTSVVLWPCGQLAASQWLVKPAQATARVVPWVLYNTVPVTTLEANLRETLQANPPDVVCFTSTSAVKAFASLGLQALCQSNTRLTALGQPTATAIKTLLGLTAHQPPQATLQALAHTCLKLESAQS
jgi:uroporphyrinogen-III synthase